MSRNRAVENSVHSEALFPLQSLEEDTAACSSRGVLGDVDCCVTSYNNQELKKELENVKRDNCSLGGALNECKESMENIERKLVKELLKILAVSLEFKSKEWL